MNIFFVDRDPHKAAHDLCDKHVVKMGVESLQIMCTVMHQYGFTVPYKPTHQQHPAVRWAGESRHNYDWLYQHECGLLAAYTARYGKTHRCAIVLQEHFDILATAFRDVLPATSGLTAVALCMPDCYREDDPVAAYRHYYREAKGPIAQWRFTPAPDWWKAA